MTTKSKYARAWNVFGLIILTIYTVALAPLMFAGRTPALWQAALAAGVGVVVLAAWAWYARKVVRR
jgi:hypothetical protein